MSMPTCPSCVYAKGICEKTGVKICYSTGCSYYEPKPMTNADRIRVMSDEELDKFLGGVQWDVANFCGGVTEKQEYPVPEQRGAWLNWLKSKAEEGET